MVAFGLVGKIESVCCQVRAIETYSEAKRLFSVRNRDVLMNAQSPHNWWSSVRYAVFGVSSSLPPLVGGGGGLVSDHFDSKQSKESVDLPLSHQSLSLVTFAFRSSEVRRLLLDFDPCGGTDSLGIFPLFLKRTADVLAPRLSVVFRRLLRLGSSILTGDMPMSLQSRRVHRPLLLITDRFP